MSNATAIPVISLFADLALGAPLMRALQDVGYEVPSPIQAATIPLLLSNRDVLGQAQTGTGKTAAFALPILARIDISQTTPQALVLAPTRELAIQVAEAFQRYAMHIPGFHVLPIYGGQSYGPQLSALRRGVHVVVGTPGRVIDHLEKGSLDLSRLRTLVLDEADEMLRMGFIDDVERILQKIPSTHQTALFSATLPAEIKRIASTYLRDPADVRVAARTGTADNIRQRYWLVSGMHKLDALTRILEAEPFDGMIVFTRTKMGTEELAEKLQARGFSAAAINGDLQQQQRERTIGQLKDGSIDILVATDVAARGLDVDRVSHVINYDVPTDPESYVHRVGRTGRAGRKGEAILFITPRERGLLRAIERATRQPVAMLELPTIQAVNDVRVARFKEQITETIAAGELELFASIVEDYERENNVPALEIAAALARMARGGAPLLLAKPLRETPVEAPEPRAPAHAPAAGPGAVRHRKVHDRHAGSLPEGLRALPARPAQAGTGIFRVEVGNAHGIKPGNLVGAIANESGLDASHIGRIEILDTFSLVELPAGLSKEILLHLKSVQVAGRPLRIRAGGEMPPLRGRQRDTGPHQGPDKSKPREHPPSHTRASAPRDSAPRAVARAPAGRTPVRAGAPVKAARKKPKA
jgi:ATP-dependent RNA helicase DeaD